MNERRRTLLFSGGYKIPTENGIYIESVDHEFYRYNNYIWDYAGPPNSIAVVTDAHRFRIALQDAPKQMFMDSPSYMWGTYLSGTTNSGTTDSTVALKDYSGATNTQLIIEKCQSSINCAAGWCNAYTFPDGTTKGYLPAEGELYLAYQKKYGIYEALTNCGGISLSEDVYWSSTFYNDGNGANNKCWSLDLSDGSIRHPFLVQDWSVRPFAPLEDSN